MASSPHWKLRRLAARSKRVLQRRAGESPAVGAYSETLEVKADAFITAYDASANYVSVWKKEMKEGRGAVANLLEKMHSWLPLVIRDIPSMDGGDIGDRPDVPDDIISDGEQLEERVDSYTGADGNPLPYKDQLLSDLDVEAAAKEWAEAEASDSTYQKLQSEVRSSAALFDVELQMFRRTLRSVVGSSDKDYQKLRTTRATTIDDEDDPNAPKPPEPITPAPPDDPQS